MRLYHVLLETRDHNYSFEVYTNDFDAVDYARIALADIISPEAAETAHVGGCSRIGFDENRTEPDVSYDGRPP